MLEDFQRDSGSLGPAVKWSVTNWQIAVDGLRVSLVE